MAAELGVRPRGAGGAQAGCGPSGLRPALWLVFGAVLGSPCSLLPPSHFYWADIWGLPSDPRPGELPLPGQPSLIPSLCHRCLGLRLLLEA